MQRQRFITTIKNVTQKKKKKSQKLNQISQCQLTTTTEAVGRGGGGAVGRKNKEKRSKRIYRTRQNIRIINVFLESLLSESFPLLRVSLPHLPRMPFSTVLSSGPAVRTAQILIWSYSFVFLLPMSAAIRISMFSFVGVLNDFLYTPQIQSLPS